MNKNSRNDEKKIDFIINKPADFACIPNKGLGEVFFERMQEYRDHIAQIDAYSQETQTYDQLLTRCIRVAQTMKRRGITSEDIVTLCCYNSLDNCLPMIASIFLGVRVASLDPTLPSSDIEHLLSLVKPKMIFCEAESEDLLESAFKKLDIVCEIITFGDTNHHTSFSEFLLSPENEDVFQVEPIRDIFQTAIIFFSSGTTGLAKGICMTHYGLLYQQQLNLKYIDPSVCLCFSSFYWISAVITFIMAILKGGSRIICRKFDENNALKMIEDYKVTFVFLAAYQLTKILQVPNIRTYEAIHLKYITIAGIKLDENKIKRIRKILPNAIVSQAYGQTEVCGYTTIFHPKEDKILTTMKPNSCGKPLEGISYKIVDIETEEILGPNKPGELRIKSESLMKEYHNDPKASVNAWDSDGYLYTGDILYYDEDFCFYFVERIKDVLKYQTWHVYPHEIELILLTHPAVKEAFIIGTPHEIDGEHPTGIVLLNPDAKVTPEELVEYVDGRVPDCKRLRGGIRIVDDIPRTPSGKIRKRDLKDMLR